MLSIIVACNTLYNNIFERKQTRDIHIEWKQTGIHKLHFCTVFPYNIPFNIYFNGYSNYERQKVKTYVDSFIKINDLSNIIFSYADVKYLLKMEITDYYDRLQIRIKYMTDESENYLFKYNYTYGIKSCKLEYNDTYDQECNVDACMYVINKIIKKIKSDFEDYKQNEYWLGLRWL